MGKRYSAYKDSGVEWIGEIPVPWSVSKLKYLSKITTGDKDTKDRIDNGQFPFFVRSPNVEKINTYSYDGEGVLTAGDGVGVGKVFHYYNGKFDYHQRVYLFYEFKKLKGRYLYYSLLGNFLKTVENQNAKSTVDSLRMHMLQDFAICLPNESDQVKLIEFLDNKTTQIDTLISKTEQQIALLKEQRQAIINQAVTKGLDPDVPMKDSGVEWIGEIPEHWEISKLKYFGQVTLGKMLTTKEKENHSLKPYLRSINVRDAEIDVSDVKEMWFSSKELKKLRLQLEDLLLTEGGEVGRTAIWKDEIPECYIQNSINRLRLSSDSPQFFLNLSHTYFNIGYYDSLVSRVSIGHLTKEKLENVWFIRPPYDEQLIIARALDQKTTQIDTLIDKSERLITLLKEHRQTLISEVVTGKICVLDECP